MKLKDLIPMMETENLSETIDFYTKLLGFECRGVYPNEENPCWANLVKDDVVIMFTEKNPNSDIEGSILTGSLYLYPDDVNKLWKDLKDKVSVSYPIDDFEYGMREFGINDNNGYLLQFGQEID